ncbi:MAG: metallophosphoesterase, partial [Gammaproteobacteria bacterium]|nr:metallophosphoesterase [Gammaproteobacteria bacterium]
MTQAHVPWIITLMAAAPGADGAAITRIWLTHAGNTPEALTINWETPVPGPSRVDYGSLDALGSTVESPAPVTLHHVTIPFPETGSVHYRVRTGDAQSATHTVKSYGGDGLRIAVAANWQERPPLDALLADNPHLLISCGDLIRGLMRFDTPGDTTYTEPFSRLIDRYPALFATTPFMPVPGNHDRQLFPRVLAPPASPIYDPDATAFRKFFPLPEPGWNWHFDVPAFGLRLIALDLSHTPDANTTWQSCQPFGADSAQLAWYRERMADSGQPFV